MTENDNQGNRLTELEKFFRESFHADAVHYVDARDSPREIKDCAVARESNGLYVIKDGKMTFIAEHCVMSVEISGESAQILMSIMKKQIVSLYPSLFGEEEDDEAYG